MDNLRLFLTSIISIITPDAIFMTIDPDPSWIGSLNVKTILLPISTPGVAAGELKLITLGGVVSPESTRLVMALLIRNVPQHACL